MKKLILTICMIILVTGCSNIECPKDSKKVDNKCYVFDYKVPEEKLTCSTGYELVDKKCVKTDKRNAEYVNTCPNGYTNYTDIGCAIINDISSSYRWICKGENLYVDGTLCMTISDATNKMSLYKCPIGTTISGGCQSTYADGQMLYSCSSKPDCISQSSYKMTFTPQTQSAVYLQCMMQGGSPNGTTCNITKYETSVFVKYGCQTGYMLVDDTCFKSTYIKSAEQEFYCPSGYELTSGRRCRKVTKTSTIKKYYCNDKEVLEDNSCVTRTETDAVLAPVCEDGYELIEQQCMSTEEVSPIKNK